MLLSSALGFAHGEEQRDLVQKWFINDTVVDEDNQPIENTTISNDHRHIMVKKVFGSKLITSEQKDVCMKKLSEIDSSDKLQLTKIYCEAAVPTLESKTETWKKLFESDEKLSLYAQWERCAGFK